MGRLVGPIVSVSHTPHVTTDGRGVGWTMCRFVDPTFLVFRAPETSLLVTNCHETKRLSLRGTVPCEEDERQSRKDNVQVSHGPPKGTDRQPHVVREEVGDGRVRRGVAQEEGRHADAHRVTGPTTTSRSRPLSVAKRNIVEGLG